MKKFIIIAALFLAFAGLAQTNQYYSVGDLTISLAPTVSFPMAAAKPSHALYGFSYDTMYWMTAHTGAGLQIGKRDLSESNTGYFDHYAAVTAYRITPLPNDFLFSRWSLNLSTGAESWINTGAKGTFLGVGSEWAFTKNARLFLNASEHFETTAYESGSELKAGVSWKF